LQNRKADNNHTAQGSDDKTFKGGPKAQKKCKTRSRDDKSGSEQSPVVLRRGRVPLITVQKKNQTPPRIRRGKRTRKTEWGAKRRNTSWNEKKKQFTLNVMGASRWELVLKK